MEISPNRLTKTVLLTVAVLLGMFTAASNGAQIIGTVQSVTTGYATVTTDTGLGPNPGDKVEIFFKMRGADIDVSVASGQVTEINGGYITVKIDKATGTVAKDQLARFNSVNPRKMPKPEAPGAPPQSPQQRSVSTLDFNYLPPGPLSPDAFGDRGVHIRQGKGNPGVYPAEPKMVMAAAYRNVLLVADEPVTSLSFEFDVPIKRFAILRVGTSRGATIPGWKMKAYDKSGKIVGSAGEKRGPYAAPRPFGVQAKGITRVEISTDNSGGTPATWNSPPIVSFAFDPGTQ